jgi:site-specific DNA recombinase
MINSQFDPTKPLRYAVYLRYSSDGQNPRSLEQQHDKINEMIRRCGRPWVFAKRFEDGGESGRLVRKRRGFQAMLQAIESKLLDVDLILVDNAERFGRAEEMASIQRTLHAYHGVLVLTADTGFSDPTSASGQMVVGVERIRANQAGRIKAYEVLRGKIDKARQGEWPGGPPPLGFRLDTTLVENGRRSRPKSVLAIVPDEAILIRQLFARAVETGHGSKRLAKWWNESPFVPETLKPVDASVVRHRLANPIYIGALHFGKVATDIVDDRRVVVRNEEFERIENFCEPIVERATFDRVAELFLLRGETRRRARQAQEHGAKGIAPLVRTVALKHALCGLVRCAHCNAAMHACRSGRTSKAGKQYVYFGCGRAQSGACENRKKVDEAKLEAAVFSRLRSRLFPPGPGIPDWFAPLRDDVQAEFERLEALSPEISAAKKKERESLERMLAGWRQSLGKPDLADSLRRGLEGDYANAEAQLASIDVWLAEHQALASSRTSLLDPVEIVDSLHRFDELLRGTSSTLLNLELAKHIKMIRCYADGRIEMIGTYLGVFSGAVEAISAISDAEHALPPTTDGRFAPVVPRYRNLRVPELSSSESSPQLAKPLPASQAMEGLAGLFLWTDPIEVGPTLWWSEAHAEECARLRLDGKTHEAIASELGVTVPTIRKALRYAAKNHPEMSELPRKMPRGRWPEAHFAEVAAQRAEGRTMAELCRIFEKSEPLIRAALVLAAERGIATSKRGSA